MIISLRWFSRWCRILLLLFSSPSRRASRRLSKRPRGKEKKDAERGRERKNEEKERKKNGRRRCSWARFCFLLSFLTDDRNDPPEVHLLLLLLEGDPAAHGAAGPCGGRGGSGGRRAAQGRGGRASEGLHCLAEWKEEKSRGGERELLLLLLSPILRRVSLRACLCYSREHVLEVSRRRRRAEERRDKRRTKK